MILALCLMCVSTSLYALFFQSCLVRFFRHKIFFLLENWSVKETQNALKHTHTHTNAERVSARGERARDAQLFSFLFSFSLSERGRFDEEEV